MSFDHKIRCISALMDANKLAELKCRFKYDINSKRKYSQVNNFFDLVGILMVRGIVSRENIALLNQICQEYFAMNFSDIPDLLSKSSPNAQGSNLFCTATAQPVQSSDLTNQSHVSGGTTQDKNVITIPSNIIDIIVAGNITEKQWRPFARALQVDTKSTTHEISNADKVQKVLRTFLQNTEPHKQWSLLEVALEKIRRIDLREQCRAILT